MTARRGRRRGRRVLVLGLLAVAGLWLVGVAALMLSARRDALGAVDDLRAAQADLEFGDVLDGDVTTTLADARDRFDAANRKIANPLTFPARYLPVLGRQVRSADALTDAGSEVLDVAVDSVEQIRLEIDEGVPRGAGRVELMRSIGEVASRADARLADVDLGPDQALIGPLRRARDELAAELDDVRRTVDRAVAASEGLEPFMAGPTTYLVLAGNNAEMRSGSGMFLSIGTLTVDQGTLSISQFEPAEDLTLDEGVGMPPELEHLWGITGPDREWRNLGLTPRFPVTAELASRMWEARGRGPVDGVLAVDIVALRLIVEVVGGVEVGGELLDADRVQPFLLHDQYEGDLAPDVSQEVTDQRREQLSEVARTVLEKVETSDPSLDELAEALRRAANGRHLLAWSPDDDAQAAWEALSMGGDVQPHSLAVGLANVAGNKLDQYVSMSADLDVAEGSEGAEVELAVEVRNDSPPDDLPYVLGYVDPELGPGGYAGLLTLSVPGAATDIEVLDGATVATSGPDGPTRVVALQVRLRPGEDRTLRVRFHLPRSVQELRVEPDARATPIAWSAGRRGAWTGNVARTLDLYAA